MIASIGGVSPIQQQYHSTEKKVSTFSRNYNNEEINRDEDMLCGSDLDSSVLSMGLAAAAADLSLVAVTSIIHYIYVYFSSIFEYMHTYIYHLKRDEYNRHGYLTSGKDAAVANLNGLIDRCATVPSNDRSVAKGRGKELFSPELGRYQAQNSAKIVRMRNEPESDISFSATTMTSI
jgi:hypothetical protein